METYFERIKKKLDLGLPGFIAQEAMTPPGRLPVEEALKLSGKDPFNGAVMAILNPLSENNWGLVYIKRPDYDGTHGGQMAFPGGKQDKEDDSLLETAKRETIEEIGIPSEKYELIGALSPLFIPPSNFLVHPFLAMAKEPLRFRLDEREVEYVWQVPVKELLLESSVSVSDFKTSYGIIKNYPCYRFGNHIVWGATAMITAEIRAILKATSF